ncbi:MAG: excinuclease ABC subunit UvrC [Leptospirales bacterium]|nr:excinuclease ABC subunit UvrC [Leptospirales bacterium]
MVSTDIFQLLRQKVARAPTSAGCYIWKDAAGESLYVGKAINLRARLRNYLSASQDNPRTLALMENAVDLEWISVGAEAEALILEATLVKERQPRFNVRLKDDKRYPYISVSTSEAFPQIFLTRTVRDNGDAYFGPFTDVRAARNTIALIHKIFPIRKVRQRLPLKKAARPCMNFHIKRCLAPCSGAVGAEEYARVVQDVLLFLEGKGEMLETMVQRRMDEYSATMAYEKAAIYRDVLINVRRTQERQSVVQTGQTNEDIIGLALREDAAQIALLEIRGGKWLDRRTFPLQGAASAAAPEILASFLRDYYLSADRLPARIVLPAHPENARLLEQLLSERAGRKVLIRSGGNSQRRSLLKIAARNAELLLSERLLAVRARDRDAALAELQQMLTLPETPSVIECYDISHFQGSHTVASGVVFVDGAPQKSAYRQYRIRSVEGIHDPASIREALSRRLQRLLNEDKSLPDLVVIDGGLTQLSAACEAAQSLSLGDLPIISLAKQREEIYLPGESAPRQFDPNSAGMRLLRRLRDEAHRFAISQHRRSRNRALLSHLVDEIPDIGPARKASLLRHLDDRKLEEASVEALMKAPGIGLETARKIAAYFASRKKPASGAEALRTASGSESSESN